MSAPAVILGIRTGRLTAPRPLRRPWPARLIVGVPLLAGEESFHDVIGRQVFFAFVPGVFFDFSMAAHLRTAVTVVTVDDDPKR